MEQVTREQGQKVAVHCHAGLGRTGLAIACFLVFSERLNAAAAVEMVRGCRPGALQTQQQVLFVSIFQQYVQYLRWVRGPWGAWGMGRAGAPPTKSSCICLS
jgi:protein tyrosine phosphatase domain-containing protein 1